MISKKVKSFLKEIKKDLGFLPKDLHITRKACALVAVSNGKVIKVDEPKVHYCPLFTSLFSYKVINKDTIENKFKCQSELCGMFTPKRVVFDEKIIVPFGASEMIMYALNRNNIDAAVIACEGAGTVITENGNLAQGIGAYMNGLFYTTPILEIIKNIEKSGGIVLSKKGALIDQFEGVKKALEIGYKKVAVTVRGDEQEIFAKIRNLEKEINTKFDKKSISIIILAICNTGISKTQAVVIKNYSDLAWACASKFIREIVGKKSILQVGVKIPVFILTLKGIDFISAYSKDTSLYENLKNIEKKHYITSSKYKENAIKMNMGKFSVFLYETPSLPIITEDEPSPLI